MIFLGDTEVVGFKLLMGTNLVNTLLFFFLSFTLDGHERVILATCFSFANVSFCLGELSLGLM